MEEQVEKILNQQPNAGAKYCTYCGIQKPLTAFNKDSSKPDGHRDTCKSCRREVNKKKDSRKLEANLRKLEEEGLQALDQMTSGGSFDPHINEVFESIMRPFGGVQGYAKHLFATYLACEPGSQRRIKIHEMILRLSDRVTKLGLAERHLEMMEERDLLKVMQANLVEYQRDNDLPPTAIPTIEGNVVYAGDKDGNRRRTADGD